MSEGESQTKILYCCIAQLGEIVAEQGEEGYQELIHALLKKIKQEQQAGRKAYVHESLSFNFISTEEDEVFIAVSVVINLLSFVFHFLRFAMNNFPLELPLLSWDTSRIVSLTMWKKIHPCCENKW
jgi:hypothetical protein